MKNRKAASSFRNLNTDERGGGHVHHGLPILEQSEEMEHD